MTNPDRPTRGHRTLDMESLKGLAHPLRVQLLESLSIYGAATASGLAERLGESSGATSYHLRQLEKHGFVREDPTRGSARERWWERTPDGITLTVTDFAPHTAERAAAETIEREWDRSRAATLSEFNARGAAELEKEWYESSAVNTANVVLTLEQLNQLVREIETVTERYAAAFKTQDVPGARPVQIQFNAFPVMGAHGPSNVGGKA